MKSTNLVILIQFFASISNDNCGFIYGDQVLINHGKFCGLRTFVGLIVCEYTILY